MTFVIIGAGPTGVEMAGAISELAKRTIVDDFRNIRTKQARIVLTGCGAEESCPDSTRSFRYRL